MRQMNPLELRLRDLLPTSKLRAMSRWAQVQLAATKGRLRNRDLVATQRRPDGIVAARFVAGRPVLDLLKTRLSRSQASCYTVELRPHSTIRSREGGYGDGPLVILCWPDDPTNGPGQLLHEVSEAVVSAMATSDSTVGDLGFRAYDAKDFEHTLFTEGSGDGGGRTPTPPTDVAAVLGALPIHKPMPQ